MTALTDAPRPTVELIGQDGNAFMVLGLCRRAAKREGWTEEQIKAFTDEATSGDYDHLLATAMKYMEVC